jgi:hypothetical protein
MNLLTIIVKTLLISIFIGLFFSGCTVQKRKYLSGYNIEWFSKNDKTKAAISNDQTATEPVRKIEKKKNKVIEVKNDEELLASKGDNFVIFNKSKKPLISKTIIHQKNEKPYVTQDKVKSKAENDGEKKKLNVFSLLGLIFGAISLAVLVGFFFPLELFTFAILCLLWIFSSIVGVILSMTGFIMCLKNPDKYKGKVLSFVGLCLILLSFLVIFYLIFR